MKHHEIKIKTGEHLHSEHREHYLEDIVTQSRKFPNCEIRSPITDKKYKINDFLKLIRHKEIELDKFFHVIFDLYSYIIIRNNLK